MRASMNRKKRGGAQNQDCRSDERRRAAGRKREKLVGLGRLELPTSPLSGVRSSHLSYRPNGIAEEKTYNHFMLHGLSCDFN